MTVSWHADLSEIFGRTKAAETSVHASRIEVDQGKECRTQVLLPYQEISRSVRSARVTGGTPASCYGRCRCSCRCNKVATMPGTQLTTDKMHTPDGHGMAPAQCMVVDISSAHRSRATCSLLADADNGRV
jgi:hypothetical protein